MTILDIYEVLFSFNFFSCLQKPTYLPIRIIEPSAYILFFPFAFFLWEENRGGLSGITSSCLHCSLFVNILGMYQINYFSILKPHF